MKPQIVQLGNTFFLVGETDYHVNWVNLDQVITMRIKKQGGKTYIHVVNDGLIDRFTSDDKQLLDLLMSKVREEQSNEQRQQVPS